jgi:ABC-type uncharacterized transport system YnjBCD substrate-binding protein
MDARQMKIKEFHIHLLNQVTFSQWKVVHSILLFKDKTNNFIHRTRNINIYEADYNMILKIKWGETIKKQKYKIQFTHLNSDAEKEKHQMIQCLLE